jgi:hypothetical protein
VKKALYLEIESCVWGDCPYCSWEDDPNGPDGYHCHHPDSKIDMIITDNEIKALEKKGTPYKYPIPKECPLQDYDVFFAAIKAVKENENADSH